MDLLQMLFAGAQGTDSPYQTPPYIGPAQDDTQDVVVQGKQKVVPPSGAEDKGGKGLFGRNGTLRDILGHIGDALLIGGNAKPIYRPQQDQKKIAADIGTDFMDNPMNAVDRLTRHGYADEAVQINNDYVKNKSLDDRYGQLKEVQQSLVDQRTLANETKVRGTISGVMSAINANKDPVKRAQLYQAWLPKLRGMVKQYNIDNLDLPDEYDPDAAEVTARTGMSVYQQKRADQIQTDTDSKINDRTIRQDQGAQRLGIQKEQGDRRISATNNSNAEKARHNLVTEYQGDQKTSQADVRLQQGDQRLSSARRAVGGPEGPAPAAAARVAPKATPKFKPGQVLYQGSHKFVVDKNGNPVAQ